MGSGRAPVSGSMGDFGNPGMLETRFPKHERPSLPRAGRSTLVSDSAGLSGQRFAEDLEAVRRHFKFQKVMTMGHS